MSRQNTIRYNIEGCRLYPTDTFYKFLQTFRKEYRGSIIIKRLGVLTRQLRPYNERVVLEIPASIESSRDFSQLSNDAFQYIPDYSQPQGLPEDIREYENDIETNLLTRKSNIIFNSEHFKDNEINAVGWLFERLRSEYSYRRKKAIIIYCKKSWIKR